MRETGNSPVTPPVQTKKEPNPFLDDPMLDTMSLAAEDLVADEDPYQTQSWKLDPDNDTRKLRTIPLGSQTDKSGKAPFNPYDTGKMPRGWKK